MTWAAWPSRDNLHTWSVPSNQASALVPAGMQPSSIAWSSAARLPHTDLLDKGSPALNLSLGAVDGQAQDAPPDGWNDDTVIAQSMNVGSNEMIDLDEIADENRRPPSIGPRGRQPGGFTWTSEERPPSRSPCSRPPASGDDARHAAEQQRLNWAAAPQPDVLWASQQAHAPLVPQASNFDIASASLSLQKLQNDVNSISASLGLPALNSEMSADRYELNAAQFLDLPTTGPLIAPPTTAHNESGLSLDDPYEDALGHMQRLIYAHQHGGGKGDNPVKEAPYMEGGSLLTKPSNCEFARVLLESVQRSLTPQVNATKVSNETFVQEPPCSQETFTWGTAGDAKYGDAGCRTAIENLFFDSVPRQFVQIHSIENAANTVQARRFLQLVKDENANVGVTFYGAQPEHVDNILHEGILPQDWGAYVGAHAGIAHLHAEADQKGQQFVCVLLTAFGRRAGDQQRLAPNQGEVNASDGQLNQSNGEEDPILVSHLITYHVHGGGRKRVGGGFDDPFLRRLSSAVQRAGSAASAARQSSNSGHARPQRGRQ